MVKLNDLVIWKESLPAFADYLAAAVERSRALDIGEPWRLSIDQSRLGDGSYRQGLITKASSWRGSRRTSTVYAMSYDHAVPSNVLDPIIDEARHRCIHAGEARAFPQRGGRPDSRCLYVGHSLNFDKRLRQHLGDGPSTTSALNLKHWIGYPNGPLVVQAYAFGTSDMTLARMLEEYLWDTMKPVLGRRGGR